MGKHKHHKGEDSKDISSDRRESVDEGARSPDKNINDSNPTNPNKIKTSLDLSDLGAGYNAEDKRVVRAITYYEDVLLPYIKENHDLFKSTNYLSIKGYATGLTGKKRRASEA